MRRLGRNGEGVETTPSLDLMQEKTSENATKKKRPVDGEGTQSEDKSQQKTLGESQKKISGLFGLGQLPEIVLCIGGGGGLYHAGIVTTTVCSSLGRLSLTELVVAPKWWYWGLQIWCVLKIWKCLGIFERSLVHDGATS